MNWPYVLSYEITDVYDFSNFALFYQQIIGQIVYIQDEKFNFNEKIKLPNLYILQQ